jgi:transmembrane sensor
MEQQRLYYLLQQYGNDSATQDELNELQHFLTSDEGRALFEETMAGIMDTMQASTFDSSPFRHLSQKVLEIDKTPAFAEATAGKPDNNSHPIPGVHVLRTAWFRYVAAAMIVLAVGMAGWIWIANKKTDAVAVNPGKFPDTTIAPGKNGAVLTLGDGRQLVLDSLGNGVVAMQQGTQVALSYGKLVYDARDSRLPTPDSRLPT